MTDTYKSRTPNRSVSKSCCGTNRRSFLKGSLGVATLPLLLKVPGVMAGPFDTEAGEYPHLIPADKKLSAEWVRSLFERREPEIYTGDQLNYIGMPIGGIGCGQLYLGGDGRLWHWDIFKSNYKRDNSLFGRKLNESFYLGSHYQSPVAFRETYSPWNGADVEQGFALRIKTGGREIVKRLDSTNFPDVEFRGEYPIGKINYKDPGLPIKASLEAFSPFIPLDARDSALPATIMSFNIENHSDKPVDVDLIGWLQNAICPYVDDKQGLGHRRSGVELGKDRVSLVYTADAANVPEDVLPLNKRHGYGSMALTLLQGDMDAAAVLDIQDIGNTEALFRQLAELDQPSQLKALDQLLVGGLAASLSLQPGESRNIDFALSWYFPEYQEITPEEGDIGPIVRIAGFRERRRHYANRFESASSVVNYLADNKERLLAGTRKWNAAWYDSSLPHWFLDRTFLTLSSMATQTFHWFDNDYTFGWEGVDCCAGSCTHVWSYAQSPGRLFPEIERLGREIVNYEAGFNKTDGTIYQRAEVDPKAATDGQCGTILRTYREHQMSSDGAFLKRLWPRVKLSIQCLLDQDRNKNGLLEGSQHHTLDANWYGPMGWISGYYLAALAAGESMAAELGEQGFAKQCRQVIDAGKQNIVSELFNGEYFIHKPDPDYPHAIRTGKGCHIDQVMGQWWAHQVGLGRVIPKNETESALHSIWKYSFAPDAAQYALDNIAIENAFRWYAMPGEAGLLICTWPKGGAVEAIPGGKLRSKENPDEWTGPGGFFNECMTGFEYQVAGHMVAEGEPDSELVKKGLAITRAVHDRYAADKRNPYNEIECSDHYARAMSSYGVYLSACGFEYHGPKGHMGFAPKIKPQDFKAAFTAAEGWGSFRQKIDAGSLNASLELAWGELSLKTFSLVFNGEVRQAIVDGNPVRFEQDQSKVTLYLPKATRLRQDQSLSIKLT